MIKGNERNKFPFVLICGQILLIACYFLIDNPPWVQGLFAVGHTMLIIGLAGIIGMHGEITVKERRAK